MPDLTFNQQRAMKDHYLRYRQVKYGERMGAPPGESRFKQSVNMMASIGALESLFAVRPKLELDSFPMRAPVGPSTDTFAQANAVKVANKPEYEARAEAALKAFLQATGSKGAGGLLDELQLLADYLVTQSGPNGAKWINAPLKTVEKAMGKTGKEYGYAYALNKDLVRGTLACTTQHALNQLVLSVKATCVEQYGMHLIKQDEQRSVRDGGRSDSGYSGWNFVVRFREHTAFGAEIQANTYDVMYGKMARADFCEQLNVSEGEYKHVYQDKLRFPGGLGHGLYDISEWTKSNATEAEGTLAAQLGLDYYDACRGKVSPIGVTILNTKLTAFGSKITSKAARDLWDHALAGSGWTFASAPVHAKVQTPTKAVRLGGR